MRESDREEKSLEKSLQEIADYVGGILDGDGSTRIRGACGIREAMSGDVVYLASPKYLPLLKQSLASAVIVAKGIDWREKPVIVVDNPALAFLKVLGIWKRKEPFDRLVHPGASVSKAAMLGHDVAIGDGVVIEDGCVIGDRTAVLANSFIGRGTRIGNDCIVYQNVTVRENALIGSRVILHCGAVIGSDGFGYETLDGRHVKVPQLGTVCIEDDVEVGANSCVDRARFGVTLIKRGTKVDNLVQIAHNVSIGEDCLLISHVAIAGSAQIGNRVILAGQVGVNSHVSVGDGAVIGAQSGVFTTVPPGAVLLGTPPRPFREEKELIIYVSKLPQLFKDVKELKKKLEEQSKDR